MNAMILAAGRGRRLMPLTNHIPKPLIKLNGESILAHHFEQLNSSGFHNVFVNISYLGHLIVKEFGYRYKGLKISYSFEPYPPLETAGGISFAQPWNLSNHPFLVINSDIVCDWPLTKVFKISSKKLQGGKLAYLVFTNSLSQKGDFYLSKNIVSNRINNNSPDKAEKLTFTGIGVYKPEFFRDVKRGTSCTIKKILVPTIEKGLVIGEHHKGVWHDIGTPKRLKEATKYYNRRIIT